MYLIIIPILNILVGLKDPLVILRNYILYVLCAEADSLVLGILEHAHELSYRSRI